MNVLEEYTSYAEKSRRAEMSRLPAIARCEVMPAISDGGATRYAVEVVGEAEDVAQHVRAETGLKAPFNNILVRQHIGSCDMWALRFVPFK